MDFAFSFVSWLVFVDCADRCVDSRTRASGQPGAAAPFIDSAMVDRGFDVLYACQDYEFDLRAGLHSIPKRFGIGRSLLDRAAVSPRRIRGYSGAILDYAA